MRRAGFVLGPSAIAPAVIGLALAAGCGFDALVLSPAPAPPPGNAAGVFTGQSFTCALAGGRGFCFGANVDGAIGSGDAETHLSPVAVDAPIGFDSLAAGENHTCGVEHGTGALWCWGYNAAGQLGLGDVTARTVPTRVPMPQAALVVAAGYNHTCAIAADRSLWCWGDNTEGQLGQDDAEGAPNALSPVRVGQNADWLAVAGGQGHTCAVETPGSMWCWGRNSESEGGSNPAMLQLRAPTQAGAFTDWTAVDVGQGSSCALRADHSLWCWGDNSFGQLGSAPATDAVEAPAQVGADTDWSQISVDAFSGCAVKTGASLWCWGRNAEGQLGVGDTTDRYAPTEVEPQAAWSATSVGRFHICALQGNGGVFCAGENSDGQLGLGDTMRRDVPTEVTLPP